MSDQRLSTFVYIDEAHDYFDENIANLLEQARKYNVGLCLAHQYLGQLDRGLYEAVKTNTAIKMVGGLSYDDARVFSQAMNKCDLAFLQSMRKHDKVTEFACFVSNRTPQPLRLTIGLGQMDDEPKITENARNQLIKRNRSRYCSPLDNRTGTDSMEHPPENPPDDEPGFTLGDPDPL